MNRELVFEETRLAIPGKGDTLVRGRVGAEERVILRGPSGCGKTTLLRVASGLLAPASGAVKFGARVITGAPPHESRAGLVFQSGALFPHLNVEDNVAFGLRFQASTRDWSADLRRARAREFLSKVGLSELASRSALELSGGERQRVALARTLICEPDYLLLDESLSAVDPKRRLEVTDWVLSLLAERPIPTIAVTHDKEEIARLGTRVVDWPEGDACLNF